MQRGPPLARARDTRFAAQLRKAACPSTGSRARGIVGDQCFAETRHVTRRVERREFKRKLLRASAVPGIRQDFPNRFAQLGNAWRVGVKSDATAGPCDACCNLRLVLIA